VSELVKVWEGIRVVWDTGFVCFVVEMVAKRQRLGEAVGLDQVEFGM
jgi:hypothetical protein